MTENAVYLSVIIPQYNEHANLERGVLEQVHEYLSKQPYSWEVIISDDGSTDNSFEFTQTFVETHPHFTLIRGQHGGKAMALKNGVELAKGKYVLTADMDQSTPLNQVEKLLKAVSDNGYSVAIGSRGQKRGNSSPVRKLASFLFSMFRRTILLRNIKDTQCGFKLYETSLAQELFPRLDAVRPAESEGWKVSAFDVELLFMAQKKGSKIAEIKVKWNDEDTSETKSRKFVKESLDMLKQIFKVRINEFKGKYRF